MSAETVGRHMRASASLDDLTAMMAADPHGHRYETSPEGSCRSCRRVFVR